MCRSYGPRHGNPWSRQPRPYGRGYCLTAHTDLGLTTDAPRLGGGGRSQTVELVRRGIIAIIEHSSQQINFRRAKVDVYEKGLR